MHLSSLPLRKCGLKYQNIFLSVYILYVTSLAEVWIEISFCNLARISQHVTSLAEVWIEISLFSHCSYPCEPSLPLRKCGLKSEYHNQMYHAGRTSLPLRKCGLKYVSHHGLLDHRRHFPCGSVD